MTSVENVVQWLHSAAFILAVAAAIVFLVRTRFWFPRYVHWFAGVALVIGLGVLAIYSADPANTGGWTRRVVVVLVFPAIVYFLFVILGGQRAAYDARRWMRCPNCGAEAHPGEVCGSCGQRLVSDRPPI